MSKFLIHREQNLLEYSNRFDISYWETVAIIVSETQPSIFPHLREPITLLDSDNTVADYLVHTLAIDTVDDGYYTIACLARIHADSPWFNWGIRLQFTSAAPFYNDVTPSIMHNWSNDTTSTFFLGELDSRNGDTIYHGVTRLNSEWAILYGAARNSDNLEYLECLIYPAVTVSGGFGGWNQGTGALHVSQVGVSKGVVLNTPLLRINSGTAVTEESQWLELNPEYNYTERDAKQEDMYRARSGRRYVYKWGDWENWKFDVKYVNSEFKSLVNTWWNSNAELLYANYDGIEVDSVRLENARLPIGKLIKPYEDLFQGVIELGTY